jgi:hypothetical protein
MECTHRLDKFVQIQSRLAMAHYVRILQRLPEFGKLTENKVGCMSGSLSAALQS